MQRIYVRKSVNMERKVYQELLAWKQKKGRKPLILTGGKAGWKDLADARIW